MEVEKRTEAASPRGSLLHDRNPQLSLPATPSSSSARLSSQPPPLSSRRTLDPAVLQRRKLRERKSRIQQTFLLISSATIVLLVGLLGWYNYLMLAPHLTSLFWAVLWSLVLARPQQWMLAALRWTDRRIAGRQPAVLAALVAAALAVVVLSPSLWSLLLAGCACCLSAWLLYGDRHTLVSVSLLLAVVLTIVFPVVFFLKTCVEETQEIVSRLKLFIASNPQFELLLRDFTSSPLYASLLRYAEGWGYERKAIEDALDLASIKQRLVTLVSGLGEQLTTVLSGALSVVAQLGHTVLSVFSFLGFLYVLLDQRNALSLSVSALSPFSEEDNSRLAGEMRRSVQSIFLCSLLIGLLHAVSTFIAFRIVGIDLCLILSFLAGFCSMLPVFSSWLVWLPAIVSMLLLHRPVQAAVLAAIQLFLCYYLDPLVYSRIRPGNPAIIGASIGNKRHERAAEMAQAGRLRHSNLTAAFVLLCSALLLLLLLVQCSGWPRLAVRELSSARC